jgi:hypothetical protein
MPDPNRRTRIQETPMKNQIKFVKMEMCQGEVKWDIVCNGESVGDITKQNEDYSTKVAGYWVSMDSGDDVYIDTDGGNTNARLAFANAKDAAREFIKNTPQPTV